MQGCSHLLVSLASHQLEAASLSLSKSNEDTHTSISKSHQLMAKTLLPLDKLAVSLLFYTWLNIYWQYFLYLTDRNKKVCQPSQLTLREKANTCISQDAEL